MSLEVKDKTRVRLVFLGAAGVGKTALIRRFLQDTFETKHRRTVEELHSREYKADTGGAMVTVEILDTSGSYSFPAMRKLSIQGGDAFALVYAVDDAPSLEAVRGLREEILAVRGDKAGAAIVVVGNKTDREAERAVPHEETLATVELDWDHSHVAASAKQNANVAEVFRELLRRAPHGLPGRLSPALRRRRETIPKDCSFRPPMNKTHSCVVS